MGKGVEGWIVIDSGLSAEGTPLFSRDALGWPEKREGRASRPAPSQLHAWLDAGAIRLDEINHPNLRRAGSHLHRCI